MTKAKLKALENVFAAEIEDQLPFQSKAKIYEGLAADGMVEYRTMVLPGRFPVRVSGWVLTVLGNLTYCSHCGDE